MMNCSTFEMMFRTNPYTAETTREEKIRLILQHQSPSLPPKAKSPAALLTGPYKAPNRSSPPTPVPPKTTILKPPMPKRRETPSMTPKTVIIPKTLPPAKAAAAATAVQRRPVPSTGLTTSMLRDYSDVKIDAGLRHLGILYYETTRRFENNK